MEKVKQLWALALAHKKISAAVVVVIIAVYFLANQKFQSDRLSYNVEETTVIEKWWKKFVKWFWKDYYK